MKDYSEQFIGNRTSKYEENDCADVFSKKDLDCFFSDLYEKIDSLQAVTANENEDRKDMNNTVETAFKLGYEQFKKEALTLIDYFEIEMLRNADMFLDMEGTYNE